MASDKQKLARVRNWDKAILTGTIANLHNVKNNLIRQGHKPGNENLANIKLAISFAKDALDRWDDDSRNLGLNVKSYCTGDDNEH